MKSSLKIRKIIQIVILGVVLMIGYGSFLMYYHMGKTFGYRDLGKNSYIETSAFAEDLRDTLIRLNTDIEQMSATRFPRTAITLYNMETEGDDEYLVVKDKEHLDYREFLMQEEYTYATSDNGVEEVTIRPENMYEADWYIISVDENTIANNNEYSVVTKDEYIRLLKRYAMPNVLNVSDMTVDEIRYYASSYNYNVKRLQKDFDNYINEHPDIEGMPSLYEESNVMESDFQNMLYDQASSALYVKDFSNIESVYLDDKFSDDCYILWLDDIEIVYSPEADMFYSSLYGWYKVPSVLYFPSFMYTDYVGTTGGAFEYIDINLFLYRFTDRNSILKNKIGSDYLEYVRAKKDLEYMERNICYYTTSDGIVYKNVAEQSRVTSCKQYVIVRKTASGEFSMELHNFDNIYMTDSYAGMLLTDMSAMIPDDEMYIGVYTTYPFVDRFGFQNDIFVRYYKYTIPAMVTSVISLIVSLILFTYISIHAGRAGREDKNIYLNALDRWPVEIMIGFGLFGAFIAFWYVRKIFFEMLDFDYLISDVAVYCLIVLLSYGLCMTAYLSLLRRGKAKQFFERSIFKGLYRLIRKLAQAISSQRNLVARTIESFILYWVAMFIGLILVAIGTYRGDIISVLLGLSVVGGVNVATLVLEIRQAKGEEMIRSVTETLASGNLEAEIPKGRPLATEAQILGNIEHLSDGLQKAVEKSIYDERMKAELITNVSHDIKTPLTSIINYVNLMKREEISNEKVVHYIDVLEQKSHRLKQLTEDLVEVSKISSGNIELECMPIDFGELVRQSVGEFDDKFAMNQLQTVISMPENPLVIYADGRRTFRVMDNLMQNVYKYAMPNTRVYVDLTEKDGRVCLAMKNISKTELNIDAKELMERFVRGDQSRSTEGSGLGLSIAGDLVRIQEGTFDIILDGDLFKVLISFPLYINEKQMSEEQDAKNSSAEVEMAIMEQDSEEIVGDNIEGDSTKEPENMERHTK